MFDLADIPEKEAAVYPKHAYCLFCRTGREKDIASVIRITNECEALIPRIEKEECRSGVWERKVKSMLPGYLFIYSDSEFDFDRIKGIDGVLKILRYKDYERDLRGDDRRFADWLYSNGGTFGVSKAIKEGTKIRIVDGPLVKYAGSILEVKRQKRQAKVEITVGSIRREIWMSFEWLEPEEIEGEK